MTSLMQEILRLLAESLGKDPASLDVDAAMDVTDGWDSLKTMEIIIAMERHFQTSFTARQMMTMDSAQSIHDALQLKGMTSTTPTGTSS
jgi:acyl carrier protein